MLEYKPQRSALYVPASNSRAIEKSADIDADWIIFDLEDSVATGDKPIARQALVDAFIGRNFGSSQVAIRCNSTDSEFFSDDIATVSTCCPDAVLLPKVSSVSELKVFADHAESVKLKTSVSSWLMIETSKGIAHLGDIVAYAIELPWSLHTLVVGHNDIASETGVSLDEERRYLIPWLMQIVLQAKQSDVRVLDSVWNRFRDLDGFEKEAVQGGKMGFDGKTLIHPSQVEIANRVFTPSDEALDRAQSIVDAFSTSENKHANVISMNGEMVERLHLVQARKLLGMAGR